MWTAGASLDTHQQRVMADGVGEGSLAEEKRGGQLRLSALGTRLLRRTRLRRRQPCFTQPIATAKRAPFRPQNASIWDMAVKADGSGAPQQNPAPPEEVTVLTNSTAPLSAGGLARTAARHPSSPSRPLIVASPFRRASSQLPAALRQTAGPPPRKQPTQLLGCRASVEVGRLLTAAATPTALKMGSVMV